MITSILGRSFTLKPGGAKRFGPAKEKGDERSEKCGSLRILIPFQPIKKEAWPIHVMRELAGDSWNCLIASTEGKIWLLGSSMALLFSVIRFQRNAKKRPGRRTFSGLPGGFLKPSIVWWYFFELKYGSSAILLSVQAVSNKSSQDIIRGLRFGSTRLDKMVSVRQMITF